MTAIRFRFSLSIVSVLVSFDASAAIFTRHDRWLNAARRRGMVTCGQMLAKPLGPKNWSRPTTLKNGERAVARGLVEMTENWMAAFARRDRTKLAHLIEFAHLYSKADISPESYDRFLDLNIIDSAGFRFPAYPATVRAMVHRNEGGEVVHFTSPLPLPTLPDWKVRRYLDQIERHVIAPIAERAQELGIGGEASTEVPTLDGPRTPFDGSLLVDLGDDFAPITLITPFGRLPILTASKLGHDKEWKELKAFVHESLALLPADLPEDLGGEHGRILAAVSDVDGGRFSFPDRVIETGPESIDSLREKWNALRPERRESFRIRPK